MLCALFTACRTQRSTETVSESVRDSVSTSLHRDTAAVEHHTSQVIREKRDSWRDRLLIVTPLGDTLKDYQRQYICVERDSHLRDSLATYKARLDSALTAVTASSTQRTEVVVKEKPSPWRRLKEQVQWSALAAAVVWALYIVIRKKGGKG